MQTVSTEMDIWYLTEPGNHGNKIMQSNNTKEQNIKSRKQSIKVLRNQMAQSLERLPSKLDEEDDEDEEEEEEEELDDGDGKMAEGGYDPKEFESLTAPPEVTALFPNILLYTPASIELDYKLKPFIPEYIPTVGDIDAFIKVSLLFAVNCAQE